ncbi:RimJ/RimL family protein N-acetyltransferase [Paenibacillus mucilaginosus]
MFILETDRLGLRPMVVEDAPSLYSVFSDPEVMRYYPAPFTEEQTGDWIQRNQTRYQRDGLGLWAVCLKETGAVIGDCGLVKQNVEGHSEVEIGYHIRRQSWGMGFPRRQLWPAKRMASGSWGSTS